MFRGCVLTLLVTAPCYFPIAQVDCITPVVKAHQLARAKVTDEMVRAFMAVRKMVV